MGTIDTLERDLLECGVPFSEAHALANRYARALQTSSHIDWIELYVGIFATLRQALEHTQIVNAEALDRMLLLLNDDLGRQLFEEEARAELAHAVAS